MAKVPKSRLVTGAANIDLALSMLPVAVANRIAKPALKTFASVLAQGMRKALPAATTPGHTNQNIKKVIGSAGVKKYAGRTLAAKAGVNVGKASRSVVRAFAPHAHLYAMGTLARVQNKTGRSTGTMPANPFVRVGARAVEARARNRMFETFRKRWAKEVPKLMQKAGVKKLKSAIGGIL